MHGRSIRSGLLLAGAFALAVPLTAAASTHDAAAATATCATGGQVPTYDNFNGDDWPDAVVGVPDEDIHDISNAGRIEVRYTNGQAQGIHEPDPRAGDHFGTAFADVQVNDDSCTDLVVGAPGRDVGGRTNAGAVFVYLGSPTGLVYAGEYHQGDNGVPGAAQAGADFGAAIAPEYAEQLPRHSVWVGAPGTDVSGSTDAGAVAGENGGAGSVLVGLPAIGGGAHRWHQETGASEAGDHFGASLSYLHAFPS